MIIAGEKRIIIELNDRSHDSHIQRDENRAKLLNKTGFEVIVIDNHEVETGVGVNIQKLHDTLKDKSISLFRKNQVSSFEKFLLATKLSHQLQIVVVEAILSGLLEPYSSGVVYLDDHSIFFDDKDLDFILEKTREDLAQLIENLSLLYRQTVGFGRIAFKRFTEKSKDNCVVISFNENFSCSAPKLIIQDISFHRPLLHYGRSCEPVVLKDVQESLVGYFLKYIFRHSSLREGQFEAISRALSGKDSIILLPTGAGKSVAFQLSALLLPGMAVVIDPIISLIEDQIDNLDRQGIDRAIGISSQIADPKLKSKLIAIVGQGEYLFCYVAPERFQTEEFRGTLRSLTTNIPVCLIAIDEAHCVSEWGHNFRTSYLNIGRNTREYCRYKQYVPPLLALTGTASNAVLRDVQRELQIDDFDAIITPTTFDRKELHYSVFSSHSKEKISILRAVLQRYIPEKFGVSEASFYQLHDDRTNSGIVFCPHVGGQFGVLENASRIVAETGIEAQPYGGKTPRRWTPEKWHAHKRKVSKDFKNNKILLLVATKAFGMGIDKPNIRYTVHFGLPHSIEGFYQEAGRAGRDQNQAECVVFVSNDNQERTEKILSPRTPLEEIAKIMNELEGDWDAADDITRAMYFHVKTFRGIQEELVDIGLILETIEREGSLTKRNTINVVVSNSDRNSVEKSIHRLLTIGVILDYTVDYSTNEFHVEISGIEKEKVIERYARYVSGYNKGRVKTEVGKLTKHMDKSYKDFVKSSCQILIEFIYDTIERGRRRALLEMLKVTEAALNGNQDKIVRSRVLRYLESTYSEEIESIVNGGNAGFLELKKLIEGYESESGEVIGGIRSPKDAAEIRGQAARYLESTPDHPGLCFLRALSEIYCTKFDLNMALQNIMAGITHSFTRYNLEKNIVFSILVWLLMRICERRGAIYSNVVTELLYYVDMPDFARAILKDKSLDDEMIYEPSVFLLKAISEKALAVV